MHRLLTGVVALRAGEDASAPRGGLHRLELVAKACSYSNKNCETLSHNVAAFRFVEIGVDSAQKFISKLIGGEF